jgi:hypothetical protein
MGNDNKGLDVTLAGHIEVRNNRTYLKVAERSRNAYLFRPETLTWASSLRRTIRSQITTSFFTYGTQIKFVNYKENEDGNG